MTLLIKNVISGQYQAVINIIPTEYSDKIKLLTNIVLVGPNQQTHHHQGQETKWFYFGIPHNNNKAQGGLLWEHPLHTIIIISYHIITIDSETCKRVKLLNEFQGNLLNKKNYSIKIFLW